MPGQQKKSLNAVIAGCYIFLAVTVLMVGRGNPLQLPATQSAACAFFIVATFFAIERQIMAWCMPSSACRAAAVMHDGVHHSTMSMVAQAGPLSGGPVSGNAGISTPVWAIASERGNSSDSMNPCYQRLPSWLRPQPKNTQNPRSATRTPFLNSATTVGARLSVSKSFRSGYTSTISVLLRWLPHILFMPFPTSTMILRM
ncbi:ash family protein [Salmonella enterica]|nr:ash family protein [Salmonella enterica]